jgi:hypothetical protein
LDVCDQAFFDFYYRTNLAAVGGARGSLFQDFRGEHSSRFGVVGLVVLDDFSDDEWHRSFDKITFLS